MSARRSYLVIVDDTPESRVALGFAARRVLATGGRLMLLAILPLDDFVQWGAVQEAMEAEARETADLLLATVAGEVKAKHGIEATTAVRRGSAVEEILAAIAEDGSIDALVLGAASKGAPGPLVGYFAGEAAGQLPCPLMIVPGGLDDAALDRVA